MNMQKITILDQQLQDGVQQAISNLQMAGIKIWVLTGDKQGFSIVSYPVLIDKFVFLPNNCLFIQKLPSILVILVIY